MSLLSRYVFWRILISATAIYGVALFLVWLVGILRLFELVSTKGQTLWAVMGQAVLSMPPLARDFLIICIGVGIARGFSEFQASRELHIMHVSDRVRSIWSATAIIAFVGGAIALLIAHFIQPYSARAMSDWREQVAADLVSETLKPGQFTEIADQVVVRIDGRSLDGTIRNFFADDYRTEIHRTYFAREAVIVRSDEQYLISLRDGRVETASADGRFQTLSFDRYELAVQSLTQTEDDQLSLRHMTSIQAIAEQGWTPQTAEIIARRSAETTRVLAFVFAIGAFLIFPHARRGRTYIPPEAIVVLAGLLERILSNALGNIDMIWGYFAGSGLFALAGLGVMLARRALWRLRRNHALAS